MPAQPKSETLSAKEFAASLLRFEDIEQTRNDVWYAAYRQAEEAMKPEIKAMSRLSQWILHHTPWRLLGKDRQKNFRYLQKHLRDIALIQDFPRDAVPFGFPIQVKNRDNIIKKLHAKKIFAAIHWPNLPSSAKAFPFEHQMAKSILTLPCDHRYTEEEMQHIVLELRKIL